MNEWAGAYRGRRVLLTGHTGFKGGWLALWLRRLGADVIGYSLPPVAGPTLFADAGVGRAVRHVEGDVRDLDHLTRIWRDTRPEIVFHLAAQAIVRESYRTPLDTVTTNVLGTVNVMEAARRANEPVALVLITSDKCYENHEWERGYAEDDELGGRDVYSGSKAAAETLISSYRRSFFEQGGRGESTGRSGRSGSSGSSDNDLRVAVASTRAGNVIGGGDWAPDRIVPDTIRALEAGRPVDVRNPGAVRPWQHVLEPLSGYLHLGARLLARSSPDCCGAWNFGPAAHNTRTVGELVARIVEQWGSGTWRDAPDPSAPHEATLLRLDIEKAARDLGWMPRWNFDQAVETTIAWYAARRRGANMAEWCDWQIGEYERTPVAAPPQEARLRDAPARQAPVR